MRINPLFKEGLELISKPGFRRIYGLCIIALGVSFFLILPSEGPGSAAASIGPPPIFINMATAAAIAALLAVVASVSLLSGRSAEASQWFHHTGFVDYAAGKTAINLIISILYGALLLPFLILAAHFEALPFIGAFAASAYLFGVFISYAFLMEVLRLALPSFPLIRRIIIWAIFCFHLLLTSGIAPGFNPVARLSALNLSMESSNSDGLILSSLKSGLFPLLVLLPVFLVLSYFLAGRRPKDG
ncbi:MAG: hypothetical protein JEZ04_12520 [Spirochaetales bacterium]|nr:hypothetical protein [Spirochaetales bacterium]